jgi:uncharacterized membrane protein YfcA
MAWPIAWVNIAGTLPGVFIGCILRIKYLPNPGHFKFFVGFVLFYIAIRVLYDLTPRAAIGNRKTKALEDKFKQQFNRQNNREDSEPARHVAVRSINFSLSRYTYEFYGETFSFNPIILFLLSFAVGIVGGTYGIGGGAIIAPFLIAIFGLPIYTIAGAALLGTFMTSISGVIFYMVIAPMYAHTGLSIAPDWKLGILFGIGGFLGIYCGARLQKYFPAKTIKLILGLIILFLSIRYIVSIF